MLNVTGMPDVVDQTFLVIQHCSPIFRLVKFSLSNHVHTKHRDFQTSIEAIPVHHYGCLLSMYGECVMQMMWVSGTVSGRRTARATLLAVMYACIIANYRATVKHVSRSDPCCKQLTQSTKAINVMQFQKIPFLFVQRRLKTQGVHRGVQDNDRCV